MEKRVESRVGGGGETRSGATGLGSEATAVQVLEILDQLLELQVQVLELLVQVL